LASASYTPAFECDPGEFFDIKKFRAPQMIVALLNPRVDASHFDLCSNRGVFRMFAINFNPAAKTREPAASCSEELMHAETNR
jgi:hypothetical protein